MGSARWYQAAGRTLACPPGCRVYDEGLLLRWLELAGCIVTVDALNTQKDIAREIKEADVEYVLALKGNHPLLHREVNDFLLDARTRSFAGVSHDFFEEADKDRGRLAIRRH